MRRNGTELLFHLIGDLFHLLFVVFFIFGNRRFCTPSHAKKTNTFGFNYMRERDRKWERGKDEARRRDRGMEMDFTCSRLTCIIGQALVKSLRGSDPKNNSLMSHLMFQPKAIFVNMGKYASEMP